MNPCKPLYLLVTSDKYELPLAVADSAEELARMAGVTVGTVTASLSRRKRAKRPGRSKYQVVWVPREAIHEV